MAETKIIKSGGIGFFGLLTLVFITLKLAQIGPVATWSWWWVLSPLWIPFVLMFIVFIIVMIIVIEAACWHCN